MGIWLASGGCNTPHPLDLSAQYSQPCLRPVCSPLPRLCSLPLGSPAKGRVTSQDWLSGVHVLGENDEAQLDGTHAGAMSLPPPCSAAETAVFCLPRAQPVLSSRLLGLSRVG